MSPTLYFHQAKILENKNPEYSGKLTIHFDRLCSERDRETWGLLKFFSPFHNIVQLNHALLQSCKLERGGF